MNKFVYYFSMLLNDIFVAKGGTRGIVNMFFVNYFVMIIEAILLLYDANGERGWDDKRRNSNKRLFVILVTVQWILLIGLRGNTVGSDTPNYMNMFDEMRARSWAAVFGEFKYFKEDIMKALDQEIGFKLFEKLVGTFTSSYTVYKFIVGIIVMVPYGFFVYRNSRDPFLSFSLFDAILYSLFAITGYRQAISISIALLIGYEFIKTRKFWPFLSLLLFAIFFHKSTVLILMYYFLADKKITKSYRDAAIVGVLVLIVFRRSIFPVAVRIMGYEKYEAYSLGQTTFLTMYAMLSALAVWRKDKVIEKNPQAIQYYNAMILSGFVLPFAIMNPTALRMVYNYFLIVTLLVPEMMLSFEKKIDVMTAYSVTTAIFFLYIFTKAPQYYFFWQ